MNDHARTICDLYVDAGCRAVCPIADACAMRAGDTRDIVWQRLNAAAEQHYQRVEA